MPLSRREWLKGLAALGALTNVSAPAFCALAAQPRLYPPRDLAYFDVPLDHGRTQIRIGYAAITWRGNDAEAIEQIAEVGYPGIQLRANALKEYPDPRMLRDLLGKHHLTFVALSSGDAPLDPAKRQATIDTHVQNARYLREAGGKYLQVIGSFDKGRIYSAGDYRYEGQLLTEIGRQVADLGIETGFHNHMGSIGETPQAVDAILDAADARYVKLELDIAHYVQGGGDPAAAIRKYDRRLLFMHLKDVKAANLPRGYEFVELGRGRVDIPAVFRAIHAIHFRGWAIIELDGERTGQTTPKESAEISKEYLEKKIGVPV